MALSEQDKDEVRQLVVDTLEEIVNEHGTYGEIRAAFKEAAKAERKAARDAAKAAPSEAAPVSEPAKAQPDPAPTGTVQSTTPTGGRVTRGTPAG